MPSRAGTSFLHRLKQQLHSQVTSCQCPLGLVPHFYTSSRISIHNMVRKVSMPSRAGTSFLPTIISAEAVI